MDRSHELPPKRSYRARLQRPCDACRRRKSCCVRDLNATQCSLCKMRDAPCTFDRAPNVRRRKPKDVSTASRAQNPVYLDLETPASTFDNDQDAPAPAAAATGRERQHEWIPQFVGLSGDQDPYVLRHCTFRENRYRHSDFACLRIQGHQWEEPAHFTVVPDGHLDSRPDWYPAIPTVDTHSEAHAILIDAFLNNIHPSYSLLDPAAFATDNQPPDPPLLGVLYMLASRYAPRACLPTEQWQAWQRFVFQALPIETRYPRLETAEAKLLWLQRHTQVHRAPTMPGLWSEVGSLVGIVHVLGLHVDPTGWTISPQQRSRRVRVANGVLILDKWLALGLGRPSFIARDNWDVPLPQETDFPNPLPTMATTAPPGVHYQSAAGGGEDFQFAKHIFIAMATLSVILSDLLESFYTIRAVERMKHMSATDLYQLLAAFEARLDAFDSQYIGPWHHHQEEPSVALDPRGTVVLAYYTLKTVLYRAILRHLPPSTPPPRPSSAHSHSYSSTLSPDAASSPYETQIRDRARHVLLAATRFLAGLTVSQTRAFWWSPVSRINFAVIGSFMFSMLLTSTDEAQVVFWVREIGRYRRLLDLHGEDDGSGGRFDTTRLAAKRLEQLSCVATGFGELDGAAAGTDESEDPWDFRI